MPDGRRCRLAYLTDNLSGMGDYQISIWQGILDGTRELGASVVCVIGGSLDFHPSNEFEGTRNFIYNMIEPEDFDGIIISGGSLGNHTSRANWEAFCKRAMKVPAMSISPAAGDMPYTIIDNKVGMAEILRHLIKEHGYKRIGFITGAMNNDDAIQRHECYRQTVIAAGFGYDKALVFEGDWTHGTGVPAADHFLALSPRPDAIVASNDNMAIGLVQALQKRGVKVPADVAVTGFDNTEEAATSFPKISTVHQPVYELAKETAQTLVRRVREGTPLPRETLVPTKIVLRESCGCDASMRLRAQAEAPRDLEAAGLEFLRGAAAQASLPAALIGELETWVRAFARARGGDVERVFKDLETMIHRYRTENTVAFMELLLSELQTQVLSRIGEQADLGAVALMLETARGIVFELKTIILQRNRRETELLSGLLVESNRALAGSFSLEALEPLACKTFPASGIDSCWVALLDEGSESSGSRYLVSMVGGKSDGTVARHGGCASLRELFLDILAKAEGHHLMLLPLYYREERLGIVAFRQATKVAFVYDALTLQLSTTIKGALLLERMKRNEEREEAQNRELKELVIPMLETLQNIAAETTKQGDMLRNVEEMNSETAESASHASDTFGKMRADLGNIIKLIGMIDDISETISVVAINASISAARAGAAGKAFGVIANEIRNLSLNTNQTTSEAGKVIDAVMGSAQNFVGSNQATLEAFATLNERIASLGSSLTKVAGHIESLAERGKIILQKLR